MDRNTPFRGPEPKLYSITILWTFCTEKLNGELITFIGSPTANLLSHFAGSGENLPYIAKSRDATLEKSYLALISCF